MLMDEPFGAVDPIVRARLQNEFLGILRRLGKTVIFVTHDIDEAIRMGDLVAIMKDGRSCSSTRRSAPLGAGRRLRRRFRRRRPGAEAAHADDRRRGSDPGALPGAPGAPSSRPRPPCATRSRSCSSGADAAAVVDADGASSGVVSLKAICERAAARTS